MNPEKSSTTHILTEQLTVAQARSYRKTLKGLEKRGEDIDNLIDVDSTQKIITEFEDLTSDSLYYKSIQKIDDELYRKPYTSLTTQIHNLISVSAWAGQVMSVDYTSVNYLIYTSYNNIYIQNLNTDVVSYIGFIVKNNIVFVDPIIQTLSILDSLLITLQKKIETIYIEFEYPYLMNGTTNENVYNWSNPSKMTALMPITNIFCYDEDGEIVSLTSLSEPVKKTIAQNLKVRIRYDI